MARKVVFLTSIVTHYREKFHNEVRALLAAAGIEYELVYSRPTEDERKKGDTIDLPWATMVDARHFGPRGIIIWQKALPQLRGADLVVIGQENRLLLNYLLQLTPAGLRPRLALWGHGRNFQARNPRSAAERWKAWWARRAQWWFAYTEETRRHVESLGFPASRITVFNNSVDTSRLRDQTASVTPERLAQLREELGLKGKHVGVFVGGIYPDKRMAFLIEAADRIRQQVPDFELLVVGGGSDLPLVRALAETRPWARVLGPRFGQEKVEIMMLGHVFLMPGLMGLAILDAAVVGLPIATTRYPWHSPEIAYLEPDVSGVMVEDWENPQAYADAVSGILTDTRVHASMSREARLMADRFSIERMAENFARGARQALDA